MNTVKRAVNILKQLESISQMEQSMSVLDAIIQKADAQVMDFDAIPLEQLKGDIARMGHPVKQELALDADNRRLFFTDKHGEDLYAEFGTAGEGHRVKRIGHQATIAKEYADIYRKAVDYDPADLDTDDNWLSVDTWHEENEEVSEEPGVIPGGTSGDKPDYNPKPEREGRGDRGFYEVEKAAGALLKEMDDYEDTECK